MKTTSITHTLIWVTLFSIAMGFLETSVVVYLRELYYPDGFDFPLTPIPPLIALTEFWREAATLVMLAGIGVLAGRSKTEKFAFFLYSFAIWDIFYYIFLKVLLNWPQSVFTWDILFLIPVPWVGPVLAPCLVSLTMIVFAFCIIYFHEKGYKYKVHIHLKEWTLLITGSLVIILSFIRDYLLYVEKWGGLEKLWTITRKESLFIEAPRYIPQEFDWWIFWIGELVLLLAISLFIRRYLSKPLKKTYTLATPGTISSSDFTDYLDGL